MCNACGFLCCGSDMFDGCGCDHCPNSDCWDIPEDDFDDDDDYEMYRCCAKPVRQPFICMEVPDV